MGSISVRNLPKNVICRIDEMAAQKRMSREGFLRQHLADMTVEGAVRSTENKYENLVQLLLDRLEENNMLMEQTMQMMERVTDFVDRGQGI